MWLKLCRSFCWYVIRKKSSTSLYLFIYLLLLQVPKDVVKYTP